MEPAFGLNRFDYSSPDAFGANARRAEDLGFEYGFIPSSPLRLMDPYVLLAGAARATDLMVIGPLLENPVVRHPAVVASSIATIEMLAPGRTMLAYGIGDTAVRLVGKRPARVGELADAIWFTRRLLHGESVDVGAAAPARLPFARPVPVWIAATGPRTLRMAGGVADGVFIRVGTHPENLRLAVAAVHEGARDAGRDPRDVRLGAVFHTVLDEDPDVSGRIARSIAAGYYEYSPWIFEQAGLAWNGPPIEDLKRQVWPDFHHHRGLEESGAAVDFLSDETAGAFALHGTVDDITTQLEDILALSLGIDIIVPHPALSVARSGDIRTGAYMSAIAEGVIKRLASR